MKFIIDFIKGIFVGVANVIPGVSGGTMAVSFGIYDKLLSSISNLIKDFKKSFKTLLPIILGMVFGVVAFTFIIPWLLKNVPFVTAMAFTGLILGGLPTMLYSLKESWAMDKNRSLVISIILFLLLAAIAVAMTFAGGDKESGVLLSVDAVTLIKLFFLGIIAAATMVIPGVSGSLVLMILGYYFGIITAVKDFITALKNFDIDTLIEQTILLIPFGIGCVLGIFFISKLISWLFLKFSSATFSGILGLIVTSPLSIFVKVDQEYSLSSTTVLHIFIGVVVLIVCGGVTYYMGSLEPKEN